jgi:DNA-binding NtrC family response regulator
MFWAWLGNIRELQNSVERAVSMAESPIIDVLDLPPDLFDAAVRGKTGVILNGPDRSWNFCPHEGVRRQRKPI